MNKDKSPILIVNSIAALMRRLGLPAPLHPLVALINYDLVKVALTDVGSQFSLDFYKISFKTSFRGQVRYGPGHYDFEEGGLAFLAPHQIVTMSDEESSYEGYALFFHPDLLRTYTLGNKINSYGFFSYAISEAVYLSDKEKQVIANIFAAMETELNSNIDHFSQDVLVTQIELLLHHSNRFYNRQFATRKVVYHELISRMHLYLDNRFEQSAYNGLPTVQEVAEELRLSPKYLTDMLKSLTAMSAQQHIHSRLIEQAKDILSHTDLTIAEIAYRLGFEHPQSFHKLFKQKTNMSPSAYRASFN